MDHKELELFFRDISDILSIKLNPPQKFIWTKTFKNTSLKDAKALIEKAYQNETKARLTLGDLIKYRTKQVNQMSDYIRTDCEICCQGAITVQKKRNDMIYEYAYSCSCPAGERFPYPKVDIYKIRDMKDLGNGKYVLERPKAVKKYAEKAKQYIGKLPDKRTKPIPW